MTARKRERDLRGGEEDEKNLSVLLSVLFKKTLLFHESFGIKEFVKNHKQDEFTIKVMAISFRIQQQQQQQHWHPCLLRTNPLSAPFTFT